ncbi:MAG: GNAT family N-acetyltransferase [Candidatus Binataceae bacterium]
MPLDPKPRVSFIFPEQYPQAAVALGRAFINDPPLVAILPDVTDPAARATRLAGLFRAVLSIQRRMGQPVFGILDDGKVVGAAVVEGAGYTSMATFLAFGLPNVPRIVSAVGWGGLRRSIQLMDVLARNHPREPHLYLNLLGVDPEYQRKHCGQALLEHLRVQAAERTDVAGVYLETATEANVAYYSSKGFEVMGEIFPLGVRMWRMFQRKRPSA